VTSDGRKKVKSRAEEGGEKTVAARAPIMLLVAAWLVPGLGHWILGRRARAAVFGAVVLCAFTTGVLLSGELGTPKPDNPFSWLSTFACFGNGILYLVRIVWINGLGEIFNGFPFGVAGGGSSSAAGFAYGNTFLYTGGLMNLLAVLDASDIARGVKD
jgi:hypothetical protein